MGFEEFINSTISNGNNTKASASKKQRTAEEITEEFMAIAEAYGKKGG